MVGLLTVRLLQAYHEGAGEIARLWLAAAQVKPFSKLLLIHSMLRHDRSAADTAVSASACSDRGSCWLHFR